jgi:multiple sugar transport system permease protein
MTNLDQSPLSVRLATLGPMAVVLLALTVLPILNLVVASFQEVRWSGGTRVATWHGLDNYAEMASDPLLHAGLVNTAIFVVVATAAQVTLGLALAVLCHGIGRTSRPFRTIIILPVLIPGIIIGAIWKLMYNYQFGIINQLLEWLGVERLDWLGSPELALLSVIIVDVWHWTPFSFLLLLAALESLPSDVYEAARIDGASGWQTFTNITLPLLMPAIFVTVAFRAMTAIKVFDEIFLLTGGGPGTSTEVLSFTIYQRFFIEDNIGYGSAISVSVIFATALILTVALSVRRETGR